MLGLEGENDLLSYIISIIVLMVLYYVMTELQKRLIEFNIRNFLEELNVYEKSVLINVYRSILEYRKDLVDIILSGKQNIKENKELRKMLRKINETLESFVIEPVTLDPTGVIERLEHLLNVRERRFEGIADKLLPNAPTDVKHNVENLLEAASLIHTIHKITRHYYEASKFYNSPVILYQLQLILPFLKELVKIYYDAQRAFGMGIPIGDSIGPLVATRFFSDNVLTDKENRFVYSINEWKGRTIIAAKALGPGGCVGHPSRFLERIIKEQGKVSLVITVDAAIKLEGEKTGEVAVGIGAAIGDPGPEKYRIERVCTDNSIPLYAVIIKESIVDAITPLKKELLKAVINAYNSILELIEEETSEGDKVIILGIGNTIGVGNVQVNNHVKDYWAT